MHQNINQNLAKITTPNLRFIRFSSLSAITTLCYIHIPNISVKSRLNTCILCFDYVHRTRNEETRKRRRAHGHREPRETGKAGKKLSFHSRFIATAPPFDSRLKSHRRGSNGSVKGNSASKSSSVYSASPPLVSCFNSSPAISFPHGKSAESQQAISNIDDNSQNSHFTFNSLSNQTSALVPKSCRIRNLRYL